MKKIFVLGLLLLLTACATQESKRPANDSSYTTDFRYPQHTTHFALQAKKVFDEPSHGVMLRYTDKRMYGDIITLYIYPIPRISWDNVDETLNEEMVEVLNEIDHAITLGIYSAKGEVTRSDFLFTHQDKKFSGKKARLKLTHTSGKTLDSDVYLFLAEDKFIKFRTSFDADYTPDWTGDAIVQELLPEITPPPESDYMRDLRKKHEEQMANQFIRDLLEAAQKQKNKE